MSKVLGELCHCGAKKGYNQITCDKCHKEYIDDGKSDFMKND